MNSNWSILGLKWSRIGYVERLTLFGFTLYRRCGQIVEVMGFQWIEK